MNKIKAVKLKNEDGTIDSKVYYLISDAVNVDMNNGTNVQDVIGNINIYTDGSIEEQLKKLELRIKTLESKINE